MSCSFRVFRALGLAAGSITVLLLLADCGQNPSTPGTGTLSVYMAFDNGFAPGSPRTGVTPLGDDEPLPTDRTPLADLIVSFDSVHAFSCADEDTSVGEHEDDAAKGRPLTDGEDGDDPDDDADEDCQGFGVLADSTVTLSAAGLDTTLTNLLGDADLPAGDYDFLVLGIVKALVVTQAGDTVEAKVPSGRIKVNSPFTIGEGGSTDLLIVFDVNRSVVETPPGSLDFQVKPVLHSQQGWAHDDADGDDD